MENEEIVKFLDNVFVEALDDTKVNSNHKGTKENPYIYICNECEYNQYKPFLNEEDMRLMAQGWTKFVLAPSMSNRSAYKKSK